MDRLFIQSKNGWMELSPAFYYEGIKGETNQGKIEIENVNVEALEKLEAGGVKVFPRPHVLKTIKNKIFQKQYYKQHEIPTAEFIVTENLEELDSQKNFLPAVHKLGEGGYDGRGVQVLNSIDDISKGFDKPAVLEKVINIHKEISLIIAINEKGQSNVAPTVVRGYSGQDGNIFYNLFTHSCLIYHYPHISLVTNHFPHNNHNYP